MTFWVILLITGSLLAAHEAWRDVTEYRSLAVRLLTALSMFAWGFGGAGILAIAGLA